MAIAHATASGSAHGWLLPLLIVLAAIIALAALAWSLTWLMGWDGRRLAVVRHAVGEAGYEAANGWRDFVDWLRPGR